MNDLHPDVNHELVIVYTVIVSKVGLWPDEM